MQIFIEKERRLYFICRIAEFIPGIHHPYLEARKFFLEHQKAVAEELNFIKELIGQRKFKSVIDRRCQLEQTRDAFTYVASGKKIGNVILTINA